MSGVPLRGLGLCRTRSNWLSKSRPRFEKCLASSSWSTVSSDRHQYLALVIAAWKRLDLLTQTRTKGGSSDTEHTAVAVIACGESDCRADCAASAGFRWETCIIPVRSVGNGRRFQMDFRSLIRIESAEEDHESTQIGTNLHE